MKKRIICILAHLLLITSVIAQTQNNIWSLPPNYYKFPTGPVQPFLTLPGNSPYAPNVPNYAGQSPLSSHNAMHDVNGNLLFFIIDSDVYDGQGQFFGGLSFTPTAELVIMPDPANCQRYYVIGDATHTFPEQPDSVHAATADYNVVDLTNSNLPFVNSPGLFSINGATNAQYNLGITFNGFNHYAASKLRTNNGRFLFIHINSKLILLEFDANGGISIPTSQSTNFSPITARPNLRAEMELIEYFNTTFGQLMYKIALPYMNLNGGQSIYVADLDYATGTIIAGSEKNYDYPSSYLIKGLEFSPNSNYLYVTHTGGSFIDYFDVTLPTLTPQSLGVSNALDFQYSQIELGTDGKLYFAGANPQLTFTTRLATLTNPNTPNPAFWNDNALPLVYQSNTYLFQSNQSYYKSFILPDQIDGMDYYAHHIADFECCKLARTYDAIEYRAEDMNQNPITQTWQPTTTGTNPWNSTGTVTVRDKLIIPSGSNITINNMTFEFMPEAQLIVENGAKLTLNTCTLTVDNLCDPNAMWHGVEVWGTGTNTFQPQVSGRFVANNSLIEHAIVATANAKHNVNAAGKPLENSFDLTKVGGIIQGNTTVFHNNVKDVQFHDFISVIGATTINDQSNFDKCHFLTDNRLNINNRVPFAHAYLRRVKGIGFKACTFENTATSQYSYTQWGYGILSVQSLFTVADKCSINVPFPGTCPQANMDKSKFNNLFYGVYALGVGTATRTAKITNCEFNDNFRGIFLRNMTLAQVTANQINVGADIVNGPNAYGLYLWDCDKYKVEENNFSTTAGYYGVYINNSGTGDNEIYHNKFTNFVVATQAANINGYTISDGTIRGLEFRCNQYYNTADFDILVSSGAIKLDQGLCLPTNVQSPANNQFSYTANQGDYWLNNNVLVNSQYHYSPNGANLPPRTALGFINSNNTFDQPCTSLPNFDANQSCPVRVGKSLIMLGQLKAANDAIIADLESKIDAGSTNNLLNLITTSSAGNLKNNLLNASPYLSDDVLIAYISSNPSNGNLQQVLLANSPLTQVVMDILNAQNLPNGLKNQINNAQTGVSARYELETEIEFYVAENERYTNDILRIYLFDENDAGDGVADVIAYIDSTNCTSGQCLLTCAYLDNADYTAAQQTVNGLSSNTANTDFCSLYNSIIQYEQLPVAEMELLNNAGLYSTVQNVAQATSQNVEVGVAQAVLELVNTQFLDEPFEYVTANNNQRIITKEETNNVVLSTEINVYPNPAKEQLTLTHNLSAVNGIVTLTITDLMGRKLLTETINQERNTVNINNLKTGIYFYTITQNNSNIKTDKLVVE